MRVYNPDAMPSILIVDDDPDSREAVARYMKRAGYAVRSAPNGREALIAVASTMPDVIILDMMMPEMSGVEFMQVIRSYLRWASLPVILLTAYPEGSHIERAKELGARMLFRKSDYKLADLADCVAKLVADPSADCAAC